MDTSTDITLMLTQLLEEIQEQAKLTGGLPAPKVCTEHTGLHPNWSSTGTGITNTPDYRAIEPGTPSAYFTTRGIPPSYQERFAKLIRLLD